MGRLAVFFYARSAAAVVPNIDIEAEATMRQLIAVMVLCSAALFSQEPCPRPKTIKTTGTAELKVTPDQASVQIGVERQSIKARNAKAAVAETSRKILAVLKTRGVEDKDIQTAYLYLEPMIDYRNGLRITNFTAQQSLSVKLHDLSKLDDVMDAAVAAGANRIDGIEYQSSELRKYKDQARDGPRKLHARKPKGLSQHWAIRLAIHTRSRRCSEKRATIHS